MWLYVNARGDGSRGTPDLHPARAYVTAHCLACRQQTEMRSLRLPPGTGFRFLSQLRHEPENDRVFRLRTKD